MKEAWSTHTVRRNWKKHILIEFTEWLKEKAERHKRLKISSGKSKLDDTSTSNATRRKPGTEALASAAEKIKEVIQLAIAKHPSIPTQIVWPA